MADKKYVEDAPGREGRREGGRVILGDGKVWVRWKKGKTGDTRRVCRRDGQEKTVNKVKTS